VRSAQASNGETTLTFTVLAGIVAGSTSILGGDGGIWRTMTGFLFIALIGNGFDLLGLSPLAAAADGSRLGLATGDRARAGPAQLPTAAARRPGWP
jgi:ABC-type xylose transport system permease subunit